MKLTTKSGYTVETMARTIVALVKSATADERSDGIRWYTEAQSVARNLAIEADISHERAAGILAALSPRVHWKRNVDAAWSLVRTGTCATLTRSREQALAILHGGQPMDILGGPKTRAFCTAIATGGNNGVPVVDTWAVRAATRGKYDDVARSRYADVAQAYEVAARRLYMRGHDVQAIAWVVTRGKAD